MFAFFSQCIRTERFLSGEWPVTPYPREGLVGRTQLFGQFLDGGQRIERATCILQNAHFRAACVDFKQGPGTWSALLKLHTQGR